jgi:type IV fimbrial biogenesis protein FimT
MFLTYRQLPRFKLTNELGFTLIELMVTIAIAAIVMGLAIPSFNTAIKNNRLTAVTNDFITTLNFARSEAVKRGQRITICKSSDGATCVINTTSDWSQGWMVFNNPNNNTTVDAGEAVLRVQGATQAQVSIVGQSAGVTSRVSYLPNGNISPAGGSTIKICDNRSGNFGKNIIFNSIGRARTASDITC